MSPFTYCGCALSIGLRGAGKDKNLSAVLDELDPEYARASDAWQAAELREWPWLTEVKAVPAWVKRRYSDSNPLAYLIISDMFEMVTHRAATLDQLIDWVRSVEPSDPAETPAPQPAEQSLETVT